MNYRERFCGYLIPPVTGFYTFWMVSGNSSELWLSADKTPARKAKIAFTPAPANPNELPFTWNWALDLNGGSANQGRGDWHIFASQKSAPQWLVAGQEYYVEARHEVSPGDWIGVLWAKPGEDTVVPSQVIPGKFLAPLFE